MPGLLLNNVDTAVVAADLSCLREMDGWLTFWFDTRMQKYVPVYILTLDQIGIVLVAVTVLEDVGLKS
jgi:hypothetical protein